MSSQISNHYRIGRRIGAGGMAEVHEAVSQRPGGFSQRCVIKRILPHLSTDPGLFNMFVAEARLSGQLQHPNIVQVFDFGVHDNRPFLAMEYIDGIDLSTAQRRTQRNGGRLPIDFVCYVISQIATGLDYAHRRTDGSGRPLGIVHRDVSPSNIMITAEGAVKLVDFGIAKAAAHSRDERTRTDSFKGKLAYMSPQQAAGETIDHRSDQFSLGVVFYECLTQTRLFRGENDLETLARVREAKVSAPSLVRPEVTADVDAIVMRLLAWSPQERYANCAEVVETLAPILHERHADARVARKVVAELMAMDEPPPMRPVPSEPEATPAASPAATKVWFGGEQRRAGAWVRAGLMMAALGTMAAVTAASLHRQTPATAAAAAADLPTAAAADLPTAAASARPPAAAAAPPAAGAPAWAPATEPAKLPAAGASASASGQPKLAPVHGEPSGSRRSAMHKSHAHADDRPAIDRRALLSGPGRIVDPYAK